MLTRRSLLAALAGIPGVAAVARLFRWRDEPVDAHPSPFLLFRAPAPRTVEVAQRFGPKDDVLVLRDYTFEKARQPGHSPDPMAYFGFRGIKTGDMLLFPKGYGRRVILLVGKHAHPQWVSARARRDFGTDYLFVKRMGPDFPASDRISLQPGDEGIILGNASEEWV